MTKPTSVGFAFDAKPRKGAHFCVQNEMNKPKKIICLLLAAIMALSACAMFASCEDNKKGELLATYDGGEVYESQVLDWQSYFLMENIQVISQADDYQAEIAEINDSTTKFYVQLKTFRKLLADKGIATITDEMIKKYAEEVVIPSIEDSVSNSGGYEAWCKSYNVSENFANDLAENSLVNLYLENYVMDKYGVTDQLVYDYWDVYSYKYVVVPTYNFDVIMVCLADEDKADPEAWEAAKAEAQGYIDKIKAGEDFEAVKAEAIENSKNADPAKVYSVKDSVPITECVGFEDKEANLSNIEEYFEAATKESNVNLIEYADPKGNSDEYALWFSYCNMLNEFYTKHSLMNLEEGETIAEPIRHIEGYEIIMLTEKNEKTEFKNPKTDPEVYNDIYETLYNEMWDGGSGSSVEQFEKDLNEEYHVSIVYSYVSNLTKTN